MRFNHLKLIWLSLHTKKKKKKKIGIAILSPIIPNLQQFFPYLFIVLSSPYINQPIKSPNLHFFHKER